MIKPARVNDIGIILPQHERLASPDAKTLFSPVVNKSLLRAGNYNTSASPVKYAPSLCKTN